MMMSVMTMLMWSKADQRGLFQNTLDEGTEPWGVMVERVEVITIMFNKIASFSLRYFFVLANYYRNMIIEIPITR